jgi:hypothetical protein
LLVAGLALFELVAQARISAAVPSDRSWDEASAFVRARFEKGDRIVAAPQWIDPIVREHLGDLLTLRSAASTDLGGARRVWELSIRGAGERSAETELEQTFGEVTVRLRPVTSDALVYDFVEEIGHATVELGGPGETEACPRKSASPGRGGLFRGPMTPSQRFICDSKRPWLWVGETVIADLELAPRRCVWQHPAGVTPVRVTFFEVPLGDRLSVRGGIDYSNERWRSGAPVTLRIWIDDELAAELVHHDGDGWSGAEIDTSELGVERATIRFETTAPDSTARLFCWAASTRRGSADD